MLKFSFGGSLNKILDETRYDGDMNVCFPAGSTPSLSYDDKRTHDEMCLMLWLSPFLTCSILKKRIYILFNRLVSKERTILKSVLSGMIVTLLLASTLALAFGVQLAQSESKIIVVPDDYATIQKAINAANPGDSIYVRASIYYEHVVVNKTVSLRGENRLTTVIDGGGVGDVVRIEADDALFSGFTVRSSSSGFHAGIYLYNADRCVINNSIITSNLQFGILFLVSTYNIIENSEVSNNSWNGIDVGDTGSHHNTIRNNVVFQNGGNYGVDAYAGSDYTIIEDNTVYNNAWIGIAIGWSHNCVIRNNRLHNNTASSLVLDTASHCTVVNNTISNSRHGGITLLGLGNYFNNILNNTVRFGEAGIDLGASARYTTISGNVISRNNYGLRIAYNEGYPNYNNYVYHNDFLDNTVNARNSEDRYTSFWDDGYPSGGNYWSDYVGVDEKSGPDQDLPGRDGIGDRFYIIDSGNVDHYPLMKPWSPTQPLVEATVDIDPNSLSLKSKGKWITAYIELPKSYDVKDIDISMIMLNYTIPAELRPIAIGDNDNDGVPDLMVKFDRTEVISYIVRMKGRQTRFTQVKLTITGGLKNGIHFEGSDTIKIR